MINHSIIAAPASFLRHAAKGIALQIPAVRRLVAQRDSLLRERKPRFHFVEDYERMVAHFIATLPIDDAMAAAVGGDYSKIGGIERDILIGEGLQDGMSVIDLGCGSGRLAHMLGKSIDVQYLGIDIVQSLLDYAKTKSPAGYVFKLHRELSIPAPDHSADFVTAFSVFTHLLHSESYLYLEDIRRVLKPGGRCIFSFLEFSDPNHWHTFAAEIETMRARRAPASVLNTMIERCAIERWAEHLGYTVEHFVDGNDVPWRGQALAILRS